MERGVDILYWVKCLKIKIFLYFQHFWATQGLYAVVSSWTNGREKHPPFHPPFSKKKNDIFFKIPVYILEIEGFPSILVGGVNLGASQNEITPLSTPLFPTIEKFTLWTFFHPIIIFYENA